MYIKIVAKSGLNSRNIDFDAIKVILDNFVNRIIALKKSHRRPILCLSEEH